MFLLLVLPQVFLVAGTVSEGRYLYPVALFPVAVWLVVFALARFVPGRGWQVATCLMLVVLLALPLVRGLRQGRAMARANAATTQAYQAQVEQVAARAAQLGVRVVVLQPQDAALSFEAVYAMAAYLTEDHGLRAMVVTAPTGATGFTGELTDQVSEWSRQGNEIFTPYRPVRCLSLTWGTVTPRCESILQVG